MCAIIGASLTGNKVMTATSGPGFSLMQEALSYAVVAEIPCDVANVQHGGPSTGNFTHVSQGDVNQARWGTHGDHSIVALTASNHQDVFRITVEALNIAETAVMYENLEAVQSQSYGVAARGGATRSDVIISDGPINLPKVFQPGILICMTQEAYNKFSNLIRPGGLLITDTKYAIPS